MLIAGVAMDEQIRIAIIEDSQIAAARFDRIIRESTIAAERFLSDSNKAFADLLKTTTIDVALIDLGLPDGSGMISIQAARTWNPECQIIVVSGLSDPETVTQALAMGAVGYVQKDDPSIAVIDAIKQALAGGSPISSSIARKIVEHIQKTPRLTDVSNHHGLTGREIEVLTVLSKGLTHAEAAQTLSMAPTTLPVHARNIYRKLQAHNRTEAVFEARNQGIIP
jgi:DNA-binding NarL/FixJ family response regulator